jgi:hypothetical protein
LENGLDDVCDRGDVSSSAESKAVLESCEEEQSLSSLILRIWWNIPGSVVRSDGGFGSRGINIGGPSLRGKDIILGLGELARRSSQNSMSILVVDFRV